MIKNISFMLIGITIAFMMSLYVTDCLGLNNEPMFKRVKKMVDGKEYEPVISERISIEKADPVNEYTFHFQHKYQGRFDVGIYLDKMNIDNTNYYQYMELSKSPVVKFSIVFLSNNKIIISRMIPDEYLPFLAEQGNSGIKMMDYKVPEDVPMNTRITCKVRIAVPDSKLSKEYGPVRFYIKKEEYIY